ncbi:MAG TPA: DUF1062 domain-containing protein [Acidimicrobiales bacterium]|nr:DUF1062 domain-containing protein [Acidimicrobiales bacterium]
MRCTVVSSALPTITWRCPGCHRPEAFASSERFRANANGKLIDIWLVYRCTRCEATKNITVVERTPVRRVDPRLLRAAEADDAGVARRLARDVGLLRRNGASIAAGDAWSLATDAGPEDGRLELELPEPLLVRLDAIVAAATGRPAREVRPAIGLPPGSPRPDALRLWPSVAVELRPA